MSKPEHHPWGNLDFSMASKKEARISVLGFVGKSFFDDDAVWAGKIQQFLDEEKPESVSLLINSPGGNAFEGVAIHNLLKAHPADVNVTVLGVAASAAAIIAMAGDTITMPENTFLMIHDASAVAFGNRATMTRMAKALGKIDAGIARTFSSRSGLTEEQVRNMMAKETWMTAEEAVEKGFADEAIEEMEVENEFDLSIYNSVPEGLGLTGAEWEPRVLGIAPATAGKSGAGDSTMTTKKGDASPGPALTLDELKAQHPDLVNSIRAEVGPTAEEERARIQGVLAISLPGHEELVNSLAYDGKTTPEQAALAVMQAEKASRASGITNAVTDSAPAAALTASTSTTGEPAHTADPTLDPLIDWDGFKAQARTKWDGDARLRNEFLDFDGYLAYTKAMHSGKVALLTRENKSA